jgi:hypothetical protein
MILKVGAKLKIKSKKYPETGWILQNGGCQNYPNNTVFVIVEHEGTTLSGEDIVIAPVDHPDELINWHVKPSDWVNGGGSVDVQVTMGCKHNKRQ